MKSPFQHSFLSAVLSFNSVPRFRPSKFQVRILRKITCLLVLFFQFIATLAQVELQKVIPLSPNAAAIARYGEIPVGHFTGVPNISIPIYTIQSKELTLPISLSYHAGGNKVEDIASWVGLGWSLGTIPSISRNIRGLPDEGTGGYFDRFAGKTVEENYNNFNDAGHWNYFWQIFFREADSEADIFYYTLANKSGKFCYNQQLQQFQTIPRSNIKISFTPISNTFTIIDDDGSTYHFSIKETSTSGSGSGNTSTTSWYVRKIYNLNKTDSLVFGYRDEIQHLVNLSPAIKYITCSPPAGSLTSTTQINAKVIYTISFIGGVIEFDPQSLGREDLEGGIALNNIDVFNNRQRLIKTFRFNYSYLNSQLGGSGCLSVSDESKKRLMLNTVTQTDADNTGSYIHEFTYNTNIVPPCRLSPAQDFWGYYNGATGNQDLVPTARVLNQEIQGANRTVNPGTNQFGILTQIKYPTGGFTNFTFENNDVRNDEDVPAVYKDVSASLSGEAEPTTNVYSDTFRIDNPPDIYLNGGQGGAYVRVISGDVGCPRGNPCAVLTIYGYSPSNLHIRWQVNGDFDGHLPNGLYEIKAQFNQNPIQYQNFYFAVSWHEIDNSIPRNINKPAGGLRVSKIETFDGFGKSSIRKFKYTNDILSDTSSGGIFANAFFNYVDEVGYDGNPQCFRIKAYPNIQGVSHSGSPVGYRKVYEQFGNESESGMIMYEFTHVQDEDQNPFPYAPGYSYEFLRGQPLRTTTYAKNGTEFTPVKKIAYQYQDIIEAESAPFCLKPGETVITTNPNTEGSPPITAQPYYVITGWSGPSSLVETTYDPDDLAKYVSTTTLFDYNPSHHQLINTDVVNSKGQHILTTNFYPLDITLTGDAETARQDLVTKNNISTILKTERFEGSNSLEAFTTQYKKENGILKPTEIISRTKTANPETRIKFLRYDLQGNLLEQQKASDVITAYIWDYDQNLPVAEAVNAENSRIAYTSFETNNTGGWTKNSGGTTNDNTTITGLKTYSGGLSKTGLPSGNYNVTLWASGNVIVNGSSASTGLRTKNGWSYYEWKLTNVTSVQIQANNMDEVRLYPENAQMTTYCYEPLVGMTTQCDVRNDITYYEYDGFGRLLRIRDIDTNILKQFEYKYQVPANAQ